MPRWPEKTTLDQAQEVRPPRNQVEQLEKEIEYLKMQIAQQREELLGLYRRLHGQASPMTPYGEAKGLYER